MRPSVISGPDARNNNGCPDKLESIIAACALVVATRVVTVRGQRTHTMLKTSQVTLPYYIASYMPGEAAQGPFCSLKKLYSPLFTSDRQSSNSLILTTTAGTMASCVK